MKLGCLGFSLGSGLRFVPAGPNRWPLRNSIYVGPSGHSKSKWTSPLTEILYTCRCVASSAQCHSSRMCASFRFCTLPHASGNQSFDQSKSPPLLSSLSSTMNTAHVLCTVVLYIYFVCTSIVLHYGLFCSMSSVASTCLLGDHSLCLCFNCRCRILCALCLSKAAHGAVGRTSGPPPSPPEEGWTSPIDIATPIDS
jgi:hypothetical protein